jgi:hypothetical protein
MTLPSLPFTYPVLSTLIIGEPTFTSLKKLRREIYANALVAITSTRGGGTNGHLALVMPSYRRLVPCSPKCSRLRPSPTPWSRPRKRYQHSSDP